MKMVINSNDIEYVNVNVLALIGCEKEHVNNLIKVSQTMTIDVPLRNKVLIDNTTLLL
jgi:hypothetical protein